MLDELGRDRTQEKSIKPTKTPVPDNETGRALCMFEQASGGKCVLHDHRNLWCRERASAMDRGGNRFPHHLLDVLLVVLDRGSPSLPMG